MAAEVFRLYSPWAANGVGHAGHVAASRSRSGAPVVVADTRQSHRNTAPGWSWPRCRRDSIASRIADRDRWLATNSAAPNRHPSFASLHDIRKFPRDRSRPCSATCSRLLELVYIVKRRGTIVASSGSADCFRRFFRCRKGAFMRDRSPGRLPSMHIELHLSGALRWRQLFLGRNVGNGTGCRCEMDRPVANRKRVGTPSGDRRLGPPEVRRRSRP